MSRARNGADVSVYGALFHRPVPDIRGRRYGTLAALGGGRRLALRGSGRLCLGRGGGLSHGRARRGQRHPRPHPDDLNYPVEGTDEPFLRR